MILQYTYTYAYITPGTHAFSPPGGGHCAGGSGLELRAGRWGAAAFGKGWFGSQLGLGVGSRCPKMKPW